MKKSGLFKGTMIPSQRLEYLKYKELKKIAKELKKLNKKGK